MRKKIEYVGKCLYLEVGNEGMGTLVVGDLHIGFEEGLNRSGVLLTRKMFEEMIEHFDSVFRKLKEEGSVVSEIILLGDVKHGFGKGNNQEWEDVLDLFDYFIGKMGEGGKIVVVRGNHDNYLANIVERRGVDVKDYYVVGETGFVHGNKKLEEIEGRNVKRWIMGHGHPAVRISDGKGKEERYKCFLVGEYKGREIVIVPSFVDYKEGTDPREHDLGLAWGFDLGKFDVKIVSERNEEGEGESLDVLNFGKLGKLK